MSGRHVFYATLSLLAGLSLTPGTLLGQGPGEVVLIPIHGDIELGLAPFVERSLDEVPPQLEEATEAMGADIQSENATSDVEALQRKAPIDLPLAAWLLIAPLAVALLTAGLLFVTRLTRRA